MMAPTMANKGTAKKLAEANPKLRAITENKAAPGPIPNKDASAKGLRRNPCRTAPLRPKTLPVAMAARVRGNRSSIKISFKIDGSMDGLKMLTVPNRSEEKNSTIRKIKII